MRFNVRKTIGVGLAISLFVIVALGFFATSSRDFVLVFFGFASGLLAVYLLEHLKSSQARSGHHA